MKRLLLSFFLMTVFASATDSLAVQTARLSKVLWANQQQFKLSDQYMDIHAKHPVDMKCHYCWGDTYHDENGIHIEIVAEEDLPVSMPVSHRQLFQNQIVQHEILHTVLGNLGVPHEAQDDIIEGIRPAMRQHK